MGSAGAMAVGSADRYYQKKFKDLSKFVPEGVEGIVKFKGSVNKIIYNLVGGLRSSMGYLGAKTIKEMGKVMGWIKPKGQGKVDMGAVSAKIKKRLT